MIEHRDITAEEANALISRVVQTHDEEQRLAGYISQSERFIGTFAGDHALAVFGAARLSVLAEDGYCWLQVVADLRPYRIGFTRASGQLRDMMLETFTSLIGVTRERSSILWLRWLGAEISARNPQGWCPFVFRRANG